MSGYRPPKRGGGHDHYNNDRFQKHARSDSPNSAPVGSRGPNSYTPARQSSNNGPNYSTPQYGMSQKERRGETQFFDHVDRLPDPSKCEPCKLAKQELESGLVVLLSQVEAEETKPGGDKDILRCAAELRRLLSARNNHKYAEKMKELDKARPREGAYVMLPGYIEQRLEKAKDMPPLPPIEPSLQAQVFTHSSMHNKAIKGVGSSDDLSYERLEFGGDAYLEVMATRLIAHRLPHLDVPAQAHFREQLIRNDTLAAFSRAYGLPDRLKHSHVQGGKAWDKITADVFEAYVAAVIYSDPVEGFLTAEKWMNQLWATQVLGYREAVLVENVKAQEELTKLVQMKGITLSYVDEKDMENIKDGTQKFLQGVYLTGWGFTNEWLGSGFGRNKSQAAVNAAQDALKRNSIVLQEAVKKKQEFLVQQQIERDQKRTALKKRVQEGDREAIAELRRILLNDIRIKKKLASKGDKDAAAKLEELVVEEAALPAEPVANAGEKDAAQASTSTDKIEKATNDNAVMQNNAATERADTHPPRKPKHPKPEVPKSAREVLTTQSAEDFLANIMAGGKVGDGPKDSNWLEKQQKKKEKEERKKAEKLARKEEEKRASTAWQHKRAS
ncbi:hypothetical protein BU23DRAFT_598246 [Bimuria novae-zelandiae CBS 107.79]|uniref:Uncharacterized protein n=1 Tax=Bimuria novae-zelandiae CBS 107.79 TaxID=1447943 RepID=A0A6A5VBM0_9PLEO|nr:hypothetical protein BU23DRAFT_598246 [Bimuria novae-zelandiae CBS 107.79]